MGPRGCPHNCHVRETEDSSLGVGYSFTRRWESWRWACSSCSWKKSWSSAWPAVVASPSPGEPASPRADRGRAHVASEEGWPRLGTEREATELARRCRCWMRHPRTRLATRGGPHRKGKMWRAPRKHRARRGKCGEATREKRSWHQVLGWKTVLVRYPWVKRCCCSPKSCMSASKSCSLSSMVNRMSRTCLLLCVGVCCRRENDVDLVRCFVDGEDDDRWWSFLWI